jgi:ATPase subunit of ABC transporter with duplicated ATPase domains
VLLDGVSFRVGDGARAALVGENGAGKTTLLRIVAGDLVPEAGSVARSGGLGVMRQFIGSVRDDTTVQRFLVDLAPPAVRAAWDAVEAAELTLMETDDDAAQLVYADALAQWGDAGGYDTEVTWDTVTVAALGIPYDRCKYRELSTLSGGEQKRLALEALLRGPDQVLLLDEPDNYLDVPGKRWLEERLRETRKTVLFVSHDRELLARVADRVVTVEAGSATTRRRGPPGTSGWPSCAGAGTRSTRGWSSWCARCSSRRPTRRTWPPATGPRRPAWPGSRRRGRPRSGRRSSGSRCGCAAGAPACARSWPNSWSSPA